MECKMQYRVSQNQIADIKNCFLIHGKILKQYFLPTTSSFRFLLSHRSPRQVSTTVSCAFLSSLLPRSNLNWFSRDRCGVHNTDRPHRSSIDSNAFRFAEKSLARSPDYANTTDLSNPLLYIDILFKIKPRAYTRKRFC